jgi:hypothetical protein
MRLRRGRPPADPLLPISPGARSPGGSAASAVASLPKYQPPPPHWAVPSIALVIISRRVIAFDLPGYLPFDASHRSAVACQADIFKNAYAPDIFSAYQRSRPPLSYDAELSYGLPERS